MSTEKLSRLHMRIALDFYEDEKIVILEPVSREVFLRMVAYCSAQRTDGLISLKAAKTLATIAANDALAAAEECGVGRRPLAKLASKWLSSGALLAAIWSASGVEVVEGGYQVVNFLKWQRSREQIEKGSGKWAKQKRNQRAKQKTNRQLSAGGHPPMSAPPEQEQEQQQSGAVKNNKQQATTQTSTCDRDPAEFVVDDLTPGPVPVEQPRATEAAHVAAETPPTARVEQQEPEPRLDRKPTAHAQPRAGGKMPGDNVGSWAAFVAWALYAGLKPAQENKVNMGKLASITANGPIPLAVLNGIAQEIMQDSSLPNKNAGLVLYRLPAALAAFRDRGGAALISVGMTNGPTTEQMARNEEIERLRLEKMVNGIKGIPAVGRACFEEIAAM